MEPITAMIIMGVIAFGVIFVVLLFLVISRNAQTSKFGEKKTLTDEITDEPMDIFDREHNHTGSVGSRDYEDKGDRYNFMVTPHDKLLGIFTRNTFLLDNVPRSAVDVIKLSPQCGRNRWMWLINPYTANSKDAETNRFLKIIDEKDYKILTAERTILQLKDAVARATDTGHALRNIEMILSSHRRAVGKVEYRPPEEMVGIMGGAQQQEQQPR